MKKIIPIVLFLVVITAGFIWLSRSSELVPNGSNLAVDHGDPRTVKDGVYIIEGETVNLTGSTKYFGNESRGDINGDGIDDIAFILTQSPGGSGTFYYVAAAIKTETGYRGTNAVFIGDRIAPQTTVVRDNQVEVNFADRKPEESMSAKPSMGKTLYVKMVDNKLVAIENN